MTFMQYVRKCARKRPYEGKSTVLEYADEFCREALKDDTFPANPKTFWEIRLYLRSLFADWEHYVGARYVWWQYEKSRRIHG